MVETLFSLNSDLDLGKGSSKVLSFERDNGCLCILIGCNSVHSFVLANRNTEKTLVLLKCQYLTSLLVQPHSLRFSGFSSQHWGVPIYRCLAKLYLLLVFEFFSFVGV